MRALALFCLLLVGTPACQGGPAAQDPSPAATGAGATTPAPEPAPTLAASPPFSTAAVTLQLDAAEQTLPVYVADAPAERQQGLMGVEDLPDGTGMLFAFPADHVGGFYMKDTLIPLSIAFVSADGEVLAVLDMDPCTADPCEIYNPQVAYRYAVEVEQGYFAEVGLGAGSRIVVPEGIAAV